MSNDNRIRLGPEALRLIEGRDGGKQEALEDAIRDLVNGVAYASTKQEGLNEVDSGSAMTNHMLATLQVRIDGLAKQYSELATLVAAEMKMTRLLVGSSLATGTEEQRGLRQLTANIVAKITRGAEMLSDEDRKELGRLEHEFLRANRLMADQSFEMPTEPRRDEELEL